jgi:hypothetical protein
LPLFAEIRNFRISLLCIFAIAVLFQISSRIFTLFLRAGQIDLNVRPFVKLPALDSVTKLRDMTRWIQTLAICRWYQ